MKKFYTTILAIFAFVAVANAQLFSTNFDDTSYDVAGLDADLSGHADWLTAHNNGTAFWKSDYANGRIQCTNPWTRLTQQTAINANVGDVVTARAIVWLGYNNQTFNATANKDLMFIGFKSNSNDADWHDREGVVIGSEFADGGTVILKGQSDNAGGNGANGSGPFATNPSISQANKNPYEVIVQLTIGADAASSSLSARLRNTHATMGETSEIATTTGIDPELYATITTGTGAHLFTWAYGFYENNPGVTVVLFSELQLDNTTALLSTQEFNSFEFGVYPNPVKDVLNIETLEPLQKVEVIDLLGRTIITQENVSNQIDVSSLNQSIYILKLSSDRGVSTKRFIKQ